MEYVLFHPILIYPATVFCIWHEGIGIAKDAKKNSISSVLPDVNTWRSEMMLNIQVPISWMGKSRMSKMRRLQDENKMLSRSKEWRGNVRKHSGRIPTPVQFGHSSSQSAWANGKPPWRMKQRRRREREEQREGHVTESAFYLVSRDEARLNGDRVKLTQTLHFKSSKA